MHHIRFVYAGAGNAIICAAGAPTSARLKTSISSSSTARSRTESPWNRITVRVAMTTGWRKRRSAARNVVKTGVSRPSTSRSLAASSRSSASWSSTRTRRDLTVKSGKTSSFKLPNYRSRTWRIFGKLRWNERQKRIRKGLVGLWDENDAFTSRRRRQKQPTRFLDLPILSDITMQRLYDRISSLLLDVHWLRVPEHSKFRPSVLVFPQPQ